VRYKIKLVAASYLPAITVALPHVQRITAEAAKKNAGKSTAAAAALEDATGLHAGRSYPFHIALSNPLYDQITVRLSVSRMHVSTAPPKEGTTADKHRRPPFVVSLPNGSFPVTAYAEDWEYDEDDEDEEMYGLDDEDGLHSGRSGKDAESRGKVRTVGVLERRANVTVVGGEVIIGKEAQGQVKVRFAGL